VRLFVALEVPEPAGRELARRLAGVRDRLPRARWVPAENAHLTLLFLGETDEARVPALSAALREAFARHAPIPLRLSGGGTFPPGRPARVAWVGLAAPPELALLQADVTRAAVAAVGHQPEDRPYHAHVTLARCNPPWRADAAEKFVRAFAGEIGPPFVAERGVLLQSALSPKGARYTAVETFPCQPEEAP
jgi:RNA 2',3'-cyclic 3'-phosphodiesterase